MKNKNGTTENMVEYHENGNKSYEFITYPNGFTSEEYFDKNGFALNGKDSDGYSYLCTRDDDGKELAFKDSDGIYGVKGQKVTQQEYEAFIELLDQKEQQTVV